ncbi:MAG: phage tail protein [Cetobacterium sp.]|uniref:phage tail protein n=1 Tax=Cetobacterium sp. TaxID=2071632 RepID=UPI002FCBBA28
MSYKSDLINQGKRIIYENLASNYSIFDNLGKIGVFGDISFRVNDRYMLTPTGTVSKTKGKETYKHEGINSPDLTEFKKRNLRTVSMSVKLVYDYIDIQTVLKKLERMVEGEETHPLLVGGEPLADNDFILLTVEEEIGQTDSYGTSTITTVKLTFEEYIADIQRGNTISPKILKQNDTYNIDNKVIREVNKTVLKEVNKRLW